MTSVRSPISSVSLVQSNTYASSITSIETPASPLFSPTTTPHADIIRELAQKRLVTFDYLKRVLQGKCLYLNTIRISTEDLVMLYDDAKLRRKCLYYFMIGYNLAGVLDIGPLVDYVKALVTLMAEVDVWINDGTKSNIKSLFGIIKNDGDTTDTQYMEVCHVPFELDYLQTLCTFCDISCEVYARLLNVSSDCDGTFVEQVNKMDSVFKKCVTSTLKELEGVAKNAAKEEMKGLDGLVGRQMGLDDWEAVVPI
jgi:hypothetical protein